MIQNVLEPAAEDAIRRSEGLRSAVILCYLLFLLGCLNGITTLAGVIIAYAKKQDAGDSIWRSRFENLIVTFWVVAASIGVVFLSIAASLGALFGRGVFWPDFSVFALPLLLWLIALPLIALWYLYRTIRGLLRASDSRAY